MRAAIDSRRHPRRLMVIEAGEVSHTTLSDLPLRLRPGDRLVVNDAATLPASVAARIGGVDVELRLAVRAGPGRWWCVVLGDGDWRVDTDLRGPPPPIGVGQRVEMGALTGEVLRLRHGTDHLVLIDVGVSDEAFAAVLYRVGRPVQYRYLQAPVPLGAVQTPWASRPWAVEVPSAALGFSFGLLTALRARGVGLSSVTHAAGLSATGDPRLDAALPLPEPYLVPEQTARDVEDTRAAGGRVIAVGTSAARALEAAGASGTLRPGPGTAHLLLGRRGRRVVDGILTNMHGPGESHFRLMTAFADEALLAQAWSAAEGMGYEAHELGDLTLLLP